MKEFCLFDEMGNLEGDFLPSFPSEKPLPAAIYEDDGGAAEAEDFIAKQFRSQGMACVLTWVDGGDFSLDALDVLIQGISDLDGDGDVQEGGEEEAYYNDLYGAVAEAMASLGADTGKIGKFIDDEDADAGASIGTMLAGKMDAVQSDDDALISDYTLGRTDHVMESTVKVVRGGEVIQKKKRLHKVKMSSEQRAVLKKGRAKAWTAVARHHRAKSLKIGKQHGLYK